MSKFIRTIRIERTFEDDAVRFEAPPMSYAAAIKFRNAQGESQTEKNTSDLLRSEFLDVVSAIEGVRDAAGAPLSKDEIAGSAYFGALILDAAIEWMTRSAPQAGKA